MKIDGTTYHTIWLKKDNPAVVQIIDQTKLPFEFSIVDLKTTCDVSHAIRAMLVRGAPLIGVTAAYGLYLAAINAPLNDLKPTVRNAAQKFIMTRPTAVNLHAAVRYCISEINKANGRDEVVQTALNCANKLRDKEIDSCRMIGEYGLKLIQDINKSKNGKTVNILTHCNAGWLACVDYGTATAPIYLAHDQGIDVHVWVDETRPRNQGARLTAWELQQHGVPFTVIPDNTGGHLMQRGDVDIVIVGTDRTTATGDVANKIGTYLKALAAKDNKIPFYVACPSSSIDWSLSNGINEIPIEQRAPEEVYFMEGMNDSGLHTVRITPLGCDVANYGFDVTPSKLVTGLITERGVCKPRRASIAKLFPEKA